MRRHRRRKKQNKVIILSIIGMIFLLSAGYAAFSSNILVSGKGTIVEKSIQVSDLKAKVVTFGDGLYSDSYERGRYIYRGASPNNYLKLSSSDSNDNLYRIIALETDNSIKVVRDTTLTLVSFDLKDNRYDEGGYCSGTYNGNYVGCNVWGSKTTMLDSSGNNVTSWPGYYGDTNYYNLPDKEASINTYLNNDWYNSLSVEVQSYIVKHHFNVGAITYVDSDIQNIISEEKKYKWYGNVALITVSDYMNASTSDECRVSLISNWESKCSSRENCTCSTNNFLFAAQRTLSPVYNSSDQNATARTTVATMHGTGQFATITAIASSLNAYLSYKPVFYLSSDLLLTGSGTKNNPYVIQGFRNE